MTHRAFENFEFYGESGANFFEPVFRSMEPCIDESQPNTSQANYSEGFWRITSKINTKIEVRKHLESVHANHRSPNSVPHVLETATISFPFCLRFAFRRQILAYFDEFYQQIHVCLSLTRYFFGNRGKKAS